jgi:hypothetical protein
MRSLIGRAVPWFIDTARPPAQPQDRRHVHIDLLAVPGGEPLMEPEAPPSAHPGKAP